MSLTVLKHAFAAEMVSSLRDRKTAPRRFRELAHTVTQVLVVEATRDLDVTEIPIETPLETTTGTAIAHGIVFVPILRAGLGMLDAALTLAPGATVGYLGLERDETTAIATSYYSKLPSLIDKTVVLLDPMLATGGSAAWAAQHLMDAGAHRILLLCIVAAPEGIARLQESFPTLHVYTAALDRELNDRKYILPGLGDFGDRLYGTLESS